MSSVFSFHTQLVSIMDALSKTAVVEISKLVEIESKMLKVEITRGRNEICSLTEKLQLMEKLLYIAQGSREGASAAARLVARGSCSGDGGESGSPRGNTTWPTERSSLRPSEGNAATGLPNQQQEQRGLMVVKEEPSEVHHENTEQDGFREHAGQEALKVARESPEAMRRPCAIAEHQQPPFPDSFVIVSTRSSLSGPVGGETHWNPPLPPSHANPDEGKSVSQNAASQNPSALRNVKLHSLRSSATKRFGCLQCGKSFRCFSQLEIHQRSHTGEKPFRCALCGKRYAQKGHLYTHQRTHTGEKPYRCPVCGKGFIQKCTLDMHQRTHTGEKPFVCVKCGKGFTKNCNLKKHLAVHSGEKPFSCPVCGKRFAQKTYLKLHQRVHSGEKPYSCPDCGKSFSQKSSLNIHLRTHTGEKPYSCVDCGKCYAYKYGLNHHRCFADITTCPGTTSGN
ncbi:zinc finger protein 674 [Brachionichthys hirsutus]|uniref:zinc finger protein 674 n=1 Tax=Brachionichthys hirsutus TaxID=412623 RepID=UPI003604D7AC